MTATAYIAAAVVETYFANYGDVPAVWTAATSTARSQAIEVASRWIDFEFGPRWKGRRTSQDQIRDWPRTGVYDRDNYSISSTTTPTAVRNAAAEAAVLHLSGDLTTYGSTQTSARLKSETISAGGSSISVEYMGGKSETPADTKRFPKIEAMLVDLLDDYGGSVQWSPTL